MAPSSDEAIQALERESVLNETDSSLYGPSRRRSTAQRVNSARFESCSFLRTAETWSSTVFGRDVELTTHFLVGVTASYVVEHLTLSGGEPVQLGIDLRWLDPRSRERVEHEACEPRGEHRVSVGHPPAPLCRSAGSMVLVTYPRAPARTRSITSSGASETDSARKRTWDAPRHSRDHCKAATRRHVDIEQDHVGLVLADARSGSDVAGGADHLDLAARPATP